LIIEILVCSSFYLPGVHFKRIRINLDERRMNEGWTKEIGGYREDEGKRQGE
jgi:hypothetical protein